VAERHAGDGARRDPDVWLEGISQTSCKLLPDGVMDGAEEGAMDLKDEQWTVLAPLIPRPKVRADGRGRPWRDDREVLNGILWVLRTGAPWHDVPDRYPSHATCHRRFQQWTRRGVFAKILQALA